MVASTYPKYRERSGKNESVEFRVNECMQRSLNGKKLDSLSNEMRSMVAYIKWIGKDVSKNKKPNGAGIEVLPFMKRKADAAHGKLIYDINCQRCHGKNGEGTIKPDSTGYLYPPVWGKNSYTVSAGMYQLSKAAGYIKNNLPFGVSWKNPVLSNEEAWDVAAFINSQPRPRRTFKGDWPNISKKPVDYPFGPYTDHFTEDQHKYGPFDPIIKGRKEEIIFGRRNTN
jgi:thiosulfate dehydrogenase